MLTSTTRTATFLSSHLSYQDCNIPLQLPQLPSNLMDLPEFNFDPNRRRRDSSSTPTDTNLLEVIPTTRGKAMVIHQGNIY